MACRAVAVGVARGAGRTGRGRPGDWQCGGCGYMVFAWRKDCPRCACSWSGAKKTIGHGDDGRLGRRVVELERALAEAKKGGVNNKGGGKNNKGEDKTTNKGGVDDEGAEMVVTWEEVLKTVGEDGKGPDPVVLAKYKEQKETRCKIKPAPNIEKLKAQARKAEKELWEGAQKLAELERKLAEQKEKQDSLGDKVLQAKKDLQEGLVAETRRLVEDQTDSNGGKDEVDWHTKAKELYEGEELQKFVQVQEKFQEALLAKENMEKGLREACRKKQEAKQESEAQLAGAGLEKEDYDMADCEDVGEGVQEKRVGRIVADTLERAEKKARVALEQEEEKKEKASEVVQKAKAEGGKAGEAPRRV